MLKEYKLKYFDFKLLLYILTLNIIGILVIYSATNGDMELVGKQIMGIILGLIIMLIISIIPYKRILNLAIAIYIGCLIFLMLVIFFGRLVSGAKRWIVLPGIGQLQPSEFAKIGLIIFFAWLLAKLHDQINDLTALIIIAGLAALPLFLIMLEPDLSSSIVIIVCILFMLFVAGISYKWILAAVAVLIPILVIFINLLKYEMIPFLHDYQARRILAFIYPSQYADANLQQDNSIMAIGSGQLFGKGLFNNTLASVKNGNFLSEEQTDFIFAVIGEELGFIGAVLVISLIFLLVFECLYLASKAYDLEGKLICTGFASLIAFQSFANIAVASGFFPNTGLPLPFISYGVSSLISLYIGAGVILNIGLCRTKRLN